MKRVKIISVVCLVAILAGCSVLDKIAQYAPVGAAAVNAIVSIVSPSASPKLQADTAAVDKLFVDLAADANAAKASGNNSSVALDLQAILSDAPGIAADLNPLIPTKEQVFVQDGLSIVEVVLAAYEAAVGSASPAPATPAAKFGCSGYERYPDGSMHVWANCADGMDAVDAVTFGQASQAAKANPKSKPAKVGDFKRQFNSLCRLHGHADKQLKLSPLEHMHVK